jgi:UDP-glucose 4-epimerase
LRYFNPVGAHESGLIGEDPNGIPNNLMPYIAKVVFGKISYLRVFGSDYTTRDGTGERDYIHVMDLADGHLAAMNYSVDHKGFDVINLGTGLGCTVMELISICEEVTGKCINYEFIDRRKGDVASSYGAVNKAYKLLGWKAKKDLFDACGSSFKWEGLIQGGDL